MMERQTTRETVAGAPALTGIPTHVVMERDHPELVGAWVRLVRELRCRSLGAGDDPLEPDGDAAWRYLCSAPRREDDGSIGYVHVFRHGCHPASGEPLTVGVPATPGWWPADCRTLSPRKTARKAELRLVC